MRRLQRLAAKVAASSIPPMLALAALNLAIAWRLFQVEYTNQFGSIEGAFIGLARYMTRHWGDFSWFPIWHCGMPYQDTYVPLLHLTVAVTALLAKISAARAYHCVVGVTYSLGAVTLCWMAARLGAQRGAAFLSGLLYSLVSPSAFIMPQVARDIGGLWYARRLQVLTVYGEGPHISSMTLLPVAILALQHALAKRTLRAFAPAALVIAAVFLTNVPGTMALGLAVFCWICAQPQGVRRAAWVIAACASLLAYGVACFGIPPSSAATVVGNVGSMHRGFSNSLRYGPLLLAVVFAATAGAGYLLARTKLPLVVRFALLNSVLVGGMATTARLETFELLPQVGRLHLEMEMGICLLLGVLLWRLYLLVPRWLRPLGIALCLAPVAIQFSHYRLHASHDITHADLPKRSEYTSARWLDRHMPGARVYAGGSTSFWLNAFTDTPQMVGCCDQGQSMPVLSYLPYLINARTGPRHAENARIWLRALGVQAMIVNTRESSDQYKDVRDDVLFPELFRELHRENGDIIYAVFPGPASLAHVLRPDELVSVRPGNRIDGLELVKYADSISGGARPPASLEWLRGDTVRIRAALRRGDVVSVQIPWFRGWKASVHGAARRLWSDGLGFIVIAPDCEGECEISLRWAGRPDLPFAAFITIASLAAVAVMLYQRNRTVFARF